MSLTEMGIKEFGQSWKSTHGIKGLFGQQKIITQFPSLNFHHSSLITHHSYFITHHSSLNFSHPFAFITQFPSLTIFHTIWRAHACHSAAFFFFFSSSFFFFFFSLLGWLFGLGFFFFFFTKFGESRY